MISQTFLKPRSDLNVPYRRHDMVGLSGGLEAQTVEDVGATANAATPVVSTSILIGDLDIADWESLATRAEGIAETGNALRFALARVRSELIGWRDVFFDASDVNAGRLATVADQLAALGAAPEGQRKRHQSRTAVRRCWPSKTACRTPISSHARHWRGPTG